VAADGLVVEVLRHEPLVALLPVTHPLATQINLELTDLREEPFIGYPSSPPSSVHLAVTSVCRQAGFSPQVRQEVAETSSLVALVAAGLGVALAPASVRHLRISGVTHRPLRGPAQATVPLAVAYQKGPVSPLVRGYLETTRAVLSSQKQPTRPVIRIRRAVPSREHLMPAAPKRRCWPPVLDAPPRQHVVRGTDPGPARAQERPDLAADAGRVGGPGTGVRVLLGLNRLSRSVEGSSVSAIHGVSVLTGT